MNTSKHAVERVLLIAHAFPTPGQHRLWRWVQACSACEASHLIAPAGPSVHLASWHDLADRIGRVELLPGTPFHRNIRYRRAIAQAIEDASFDVIACTSPGLTRLLEPAAGATHLVDSLGVLSTPSPLGLVPSRSAPGVNDSTWQAVGPEADPLALLRGDAMPRAKAA